MNNLVKYKLIKIVNLIIGALLINIGVSCTYEPAVLLPACNRGYINLEVRPDSIYQDFEASLQSNLINPVIPSNTDNCITITDVPTVKSDSVTVSSVAPSDAIRFTVTSMHTGIWNSSVSVLGNNCPYTIACQHQVYSHSDFISPTQSLEFAVTGCTTQSSAGLLNHYIQADFNNYADNQPPCNWTQRWNIGNINWTIQNGELRANSINTNERRLLSWNTAPPDADIEILAKIQTQVKSSATHAQLVFRASGDINTVSGYIVGLSTSGGTDELRLRKCVSGNCTNTEIASQPFTYNTNTWYWLRVRGEGDVLRAKVWADGTPEPVNWTIGNAGDVTDSDINSGGWIGVGTFEQADDPRFGWFSVGLNGNSAGMPPE